MKFFFSLTLTVLTGLPFSLSAGAANEEPIPDKIVFNRDIRPIFSNTCFKCHGPDENKRKAKLRLDSKEDAYAPHKNGTPIVPGKLPQSEVYQRITAKDPEELMPPAKSGMKLTERQILLIKKWIEQGADIQPYWAFVTPKRPEVPKIQAARLRRQEVGGGGQNPIDAFIEEKLIREKLQPAAEADKTTLIRRVSLDLTGLPPTPAEVDAFLADQAPTAYEKVVDRLLASPRYGERMAMNWLDGARYADSNGYQADYERFMWPWRDWVINAFNRNEPFDQFTVEQIAGDLLPNPTSDQRLATGFNRNHRINTEGGVIAEEWRTETCVDRIETTSAVWLGLTMGCCRCHDHKYDPITQKEFYQMYAFFNSVAESGTGEERAVNHPPLLKSPTKEQQEKMTETAAAIADLERKLNTPMPEVDAAQAEWEKAVLAEKKVAWAVLEPLEVSAASGTKLTKQGDGSVLASGTIPAKDKYTVTAKTVLQGITGFRLEALPDPSLPAKGPGESPTNGNFVLTEFKVKAIDKEESSQTIKLQNATADFAQDQFPIANAIDGKNDTGWAIGTEGGKPHTAIFVAKSSVGEAGGLTLRFSLEFQSQHDLHLIGKFRLAVTTDSNPSGTALPLNLHGYLASAQRSDSQKNELRNYYRMNLSPVTKSLQEQLSKLKKEQTDLEMKVQTVMVMEDLPKTRETHILIRGQYDKPGEVVSAGVPALFPPMPPGAPKNRLGLAKWIVDPSHPLTARVAVNRFWEKFFGTGLVKTSENFGIQAEWPSHPELLDWLATEFVRLGWDMKAIQKEIVLSATYRQSSKLTPQLLERDPENRLLARGPRFRLQAEIIRDEALAISGLLVEKVGGPSVRPYQPDGIWDEMTVYGNLRNYKHDTNGGEYRRSLYTIWKRTTPPPDMTTFDMPMREICVVKRSRTNTPLQALTLLNENTYVEAARVLAQHMISEGGATPEQRIVYAFRSALARKPSAAELKVLVTGYQQRLAKFQSDPAAAKKLASVGDTKRDEKLDGAELAAYTMTANVILNLDETITKE